MTYLDTEIMGDEWVGPSPDSFWKCPTFKEGAYNINEHQHLFSENFKGLLNQYIERSIYSLTNRTYDPAPRYSLVF